MSIAKAIQTAGQQGNNNSALGEITSTGSSVSVEGVGELRQLPIVSPWGVYSVPPTGETAEVIKNYGRDKEAVYIGVVQPPRDIQPGELFLYSHGGANIHLRNDGAIVFNGRFVIYPDGTTGLI